MMNYVVIGILAAALLLPMMFVIGRTVRSWKEALLYVAWVIFCLWTAYAIVGLLIEDEGCYPRAGAPSHMIQPECEP